MTYNCWLGDATPPTPHPGMTSDAPMGPAILRVVDHVVAMACQNYHSTGDRAV